jgi:hypothetical protein
MGTLTAAVKITAPTVNTTTPVPMIFNRPNRSEVWPAIKAPTIPPTMKRVTIFPCCAGDGLFFEASIPTRMHASKVLETYKIVVELWKSKGIGHNGLVEPEICQLLFPSKIPQSEEDKPKECTAKGSRYCT